jgi:hypothetical protein
MGATRKELYDENRYLWDKIDREIELRIAAEDRLEAVKALMQDALEEWDAIAGRDTGARTTAELVGIRFMGRLDVILGGKR